jgi:hypothetical protein
MIDYNGYAFKYSFFYYICIMNGKLYQYLKKDLEKQGISIGNNCGVYFCTSDLDWVDLTIPTKGFNVDTLLKEINNLRKVDLSEYNSPSTKELELYSAIEHSVRKFKIEQIIVL